MTTREFQVPARTAANIARRHAAEAPRRCIYGCRAHARLYPGGSFCDEHSPWAVLGLPNPDTQIDPDRTLDALRAKAGLRPDQGFTGSSTILDQKNRATGRSVPGEIRRKLQHDDDPISARFHAFHADNPAVMARLVRLVREHVDAGATRLSIGALFEDLRGRVETNGKPYQLDNSLRAPYVRQLVADHPEYARLFELRTRRSA
jgi:hypothetical protein